MATTRRIVGAFGLEVLIPSSPAADAAIQRETDRVIYLLTS